MTRRRGLTIACALLLAAGAAVAGALLWPVQTEVNEEARRKARLMEEIMFGGAAVGGHFSLTDHAGQRRSLSDWRGKLVVLYFGYTFCPDVCPTDLVAIAQTIDALGPAGEAVQPVFVTLDPKRDTVRHLAQYVPYFHARLVGLTGTPEEIRAVADLYRIYFKEVPWRHGPHYLLDHSTYIFLLDTEGKYAGTLPPGTSSERLATVVRELLEDARTTAR